MTQHNDDTLKWLKLTGYERVKIDIHNCVRCEQDHNQLEFVMFTQHPQEDRDGTIWTHWAMCPVLQEPVMLRITGYSLVSQPPVSSQ